MDRYQLQFLTFHQRNPIVYQELVRLARQVRARFGPDRKIGIWLLMNHVRWYFAMERDDQETYKFCNNYAAYYARFIMEQEPDLAGIFNIKALKGDRTWIPMNDPSHASKTATSAVSGPAAQNATLNSARL